MSGGSTRLESRGSKNFTNQSYGNTHTHIEQMQIVRKNIKQPLKHQVDFPSSLCKKSKQSSPKKMSFFRVDPGDWSSKWCHFQTQRLIVEHRLAVPKNLLALRGQVPNKKNMLVGRRWSFHKYFLYVYVYVFFSFAFLLRGGKGLVFFGCLVLVLGSVWPSPVPPSGCLTGGRMEGLEEAVSQWLLGEMGDTTWNPC